MGRGLNEVFSPSFSWAQSQECSTLQMAAPSDVAERSAFLTARASCGSWRGNIQRTSSSPRTRGARSRQPPASQSARSPSGFRTAGLRRRKSWPRSRPPLIREGDPWLGRWGRSGSILGRPRAQGCQARAQDSVEGLPGHSSWAVPQGWPGCPCVF